MDWFKKQILEGKDKEFTDFDNSTANVVRDALEGMPVDEGAYLEDYYKLEDRIGYYERAEKQIDQKLRKEDLH